MSSRNFILNLTAGVTGGSARIMDTEYLIIREESPVDSVVIGRSPMAVESTGNRSPRPLIRRSGAEPDQRSADPAGVERQQNTSRRPAHGYAFCRKSSIIVSIGLRRKFTRFSATKSKNNFKSTVSNKWSCFSPRGCASP